MIVRKTFMKSRRWSAILTAPQLHLDRPMRCRIVILAIIEQTNRAAEFYNKNEGRQRARRTSNRSNCNGHVAASLKPSSAISRCFVLRLRRSHCVHDGETCPACVAERDASDERAISAAESRHDNPFEENF